MYRGEGGINFKILIFSELFYSQEGEVTWIEGKIKKIIFLFFFYFYSHEGDIEGHPAPLPIGMGTSPPGNNTQQFTVWPYGPD